MPFVEEIVRSAKARLRSNARALRLAVPVAALALPVLAAAAETPLDTFQRDIKPVLEKYCFDCHGNGVDKGGVTLDEFESVEALRDHALWSRALRNIRAGIMPPADETPLPSAEADKIMAWIKRDAFGVDPAKPDPGRVTVRRLNRVEYRNTIRDLLGVDFDTQKEFPADDTGHGFDNIADVLTLSPLLLEKYLDAAQTIVGKGVVTKPRMIVEQSIRGKEFATVKVDTTLPKPATPPEGAAPADGAPAIALPPPAPAAPVAAAEAPAVAATPPAAPAAGAPAPAAAAAPGAPGAPAVVAGQAPAGAPGAPGRGQGRGFGGRGRGGPPPVTRPVPTVEDETLIMSYYTPATVAAKRTLTQGGKYQIVLDMISHETYAENLFDLNKCQFTFTINGEKLLDQEFVREGYGKKFEFTFDRALPAGEYEIAIEMKPNAPETPQYRKLRMRINSVTFRGPLEPEFWVKTPGYDKYFTRDQVPAAAKERRAYAQEILGKFAGRAFRGPVDARALENIVNLAEKVYSQRGSDFETGVAQAMVAVIASPSFLFREDTTLPLKAGQAYPEVSEYALASRLSYFLWSSMPDDELLKLAGEGKLRANLTAQVNRMLADARAQEFIRNFAGQWLQARDIATVPITAEEVYLRDHPDPAYVEARDTMRRLQAIPQDSRTEEEAAAFAKARTATFAFARQPKPDLTDALRKAMLQETEMTFGYVIKEDRSLLELIKSDYTFLNADLAKHYGIEGVTGPEMRKVTLAPDSPRGGILTQGTVLAVTSNPTRTSPVKRGVFILETILGTPPAPPPPNIPALEEAASAEELRKLNLRDTLALHAKNPVCNSCHSRMDPLGLALENFNAMGMWRETEVGQPVLPAGTLITGESFKDIRELKDIFVTSHRRDFYYCVAEKLLTYALGRSVEYYDIATVDQLVAALEAAGGRPSALIHGIIDSAPFQQRRPSTNSLADEPAHSAPPAKRVSLTN